MLIFITFISKIVILRYILSFYLCEINSNFRPWYTSTCVWLRVLWRSYYAVKLVYQLAVYGLYPKLSSLKNHYPFLLCMDMKNTRAANRLAYDILLMGLWERGNRKICECLLISIFKRDATSALDLHSRSLTIWSKIKIWDPTCCKLLMHFFSFINSYNRCCLYH